MKRTLVILCGLFLFLAATTPIGAQDGNLLADPGMEGEYTNRGRPDLNIPAPWSLTVVESPRTQDWMNLQPVAFPHLGPGPNPQSGARAANFNRGYATFTVAMYQTVPTSPGTNLMGSAWAQIKTCNVPPNADNCASSGESGAYTRVGIDPNGGTNVFDTDIVWSSNAAPHDTWLQMNTSATATGNAVTIFLFATQNLPTQLNTLYWDSAYLGTGGPGGAAPAVPGQPAAPPPTPTPAAVPFVVPQNARPDGSIVHIVGPGDTMDSIAFAYGMTRDEVMELNPSIREPRYILQGQEIIIRPPGSVAVGNEPQPTAIAEVPSTPLETTVQQPPVVEQPQNPTPSNQRITVVGGSAGLSGYFPPRGVRNVGADITVPDMAAAPPGDALAFGVGGAGSTINTAAAAGELPAVFNSGDVASGKLAAKGVNQPPAQAETTEAPQPTDAPTATPTTPVLREPSPQSGAAPAPVFSQVPPPLDPLVEGAQVCVLMFNDLNRNRIEELGEVLLPGAVITLSGAGDPLTHTTDGVSEPFCFTGVTPGTYTVSAQAPASYGLTTARDFIVEAAEGATITIAFGAGEGVIEVQPPTAEPTEIPPTPMPDSAPTFVVRENMGVVVLVLAAIILIGGISLALIIRSRM